MSESLRPYGLQHTRLPWAKLLDLLKLWCHPTNSSSVVPFSCLQSFPASGSFPVSHFYAPGGQSIEASASASVLATNIQDWYMCTILQFTMWFQPISYSYSNLISYVKFISPEGEWVILPYTNLTCFLFTERWWSVRDRDGGANCSYWT